VPAVVYGGKVEPTLIALDPRAVMRELHRGGWQSRIYEIEAGDAPIRALIRGVQFHKVTDQPEHVDFQRLVPGEPIKVSVPVHFDNDGTSPGLKRGGVLNVVHHSVDVVCDADKIPEHFVADMAPLDFNDNVRWGDLKGTDGAKPLAGGDFVIATVVPPAKVEEAAAPAAQAKAAAKAPAKGGKK
jgi:large subunit ribosomal protein L25